MTLSMFIAQPEFLGESIYCALKKWNGYRSHRGSLFPTGIEFDAQDLSSFPQELSWILCVQLNFHTHNKVPPSQSEESYLKSQSEG